MIDRLAYFIGRTWTELFWSALSNFGRFLCHYLFWEQFGLLFNWLSLFRFFLSFLGSFFWRHNKYNGANVSWLSIADWVIKYPRWNGFPINTIASFWQRNDDQWSYSYIHNVDISYQSDHLNIYIRLNTNHKSKRNRGCKLSLGRWGNQIFVLIPFKSFFLAAIEDLYNISLDKISKVAAIKENN